MRKLLLLLVFLPMLGKAQLTPEWMAGTWEGVGYQLNTNSAWTIHLDADPANLQFEIEYPSLGCGGKWKLLYMVRDRATFQEILDYGVLSCMNFGQLTITLVDSDHISFSYFNPDVGGLNSFSTLERVPMP